MPRNLRVLKDMNGIAKESEPVTFEELGVSGLRRTGGFIFEEWLNELSDLYRANRAYIEMRDNDPIVGAILFAAELFIRKVQWYAQPGGMSDKALKKAEYLDSVLIDLNSQNFNDVISEILSMLPLGWSACEKVFKIRDKENSKFPDGKVGWKRLGFRAQETLYEWVFNKETSELEGMIQQDPVTGNNIFIPIKKILLFRTKIYKNNPQGRSILRNAYKDYWYKKRLEEDEAIGLEHDALGVLIAWVPEDVIRTDTAEHTKIKVNIGNAIRKVQTNKGSAIVMPLARDANGNKKYDLTLLEGASAGNKISQISAVIERHDTRIAQSCLYDIVMVGNKQGSGASGSYALAETKSNNFIKSLTSFLDIIKNIFNEDGVYELFKLNGDDMQELPTLEHTQLTDADLVQVGTYLKALADSGFPLFPNRELMKYLMKIAGFPEPEEEKLDEMNDNSNIEDDDSNDDENLDENVDEENADETGGIDGNE